MGMWGLGPFENDEALDWMERLIEGDEAKPIYEAAEAVAGAPPDTYIDSPDEWTALAAISLVVAKFSSLSDGIPEDAISWVNSHDIGSKEGLIQLSLLALSRIIAGFEAKRQDWVDPADAQLWLSNLHALERTVRDL